MAQAKEKGRKKRLVPDLLEAIKVSGTRRGGEGSGGEARVGGKREENSRLNIGITRLAMGVAIWVALRFSCHLQYMALGTSEPLF